jgi:hypothetical protein
MLNIMIILVYLGLEDIGKGMLSILYHSGLNSEAGVEDGNLHDQIDQNEAALFMAQAYEKGYVYV